MGKLISTLLFQPPNNPTSLPRSKYFWLKTSRGSQIPAFHIEQPHARFTVLYSHGNAEDLGMIYNYITELSRLLYVNIIAYDYTGYGLGTRHVQNIQNEKSESSEENCYSDIEAAYAYLMDVKNIDPQQVILYGRSVGSGPSCYLAQKLGIELGEFGLGGMILHSPFVSVCRVVVDLGLENKFDFFPNVSRIKDVTCPTFIIHGTKDSVVPFYHGRMMFDNLSEGIRYKPFWAEAMGHNNIEADMCSMFIKKLQRFFLYVLKTQNPAISRSERLAERIKPQVEIVINGTPLKVVADESVPKAKLERNISPRAISDAFDDKGMDNSDHSTCVSSLDGEFEFGEIECLILSEL